MLFLSLKTEHPCWTSLVFLTKWCFFTLSFFFFFFSFGCAGSLLLHAGFSLVVARGASLQLPWALCSLWWLLLLGAQALGHMGFNNCGSQAQHLWPSGPVTPRYVESSRMKDRASVSCDVGRWTLHHWASREARHYIFWETLKPVKWLNFQLGHWFFNENHRAADKFLGEIPDL